MNILFIGDVFGSIGRRVLAERLAGLLETHRAAFCIANGENTAGGIGITGNIYKKMRKYGVDCVTGGNHSFSHLDDGAGFMDEPAMLRPLNVPPGNPGHGLALFELGNGIKIGVINLIGRTFIHEAMDCPFRAADGAVETLAKQTPLIVVDMHAEASSEKAALAHHLDGKVSAVLGTHTHVQTADERVLPGGTAFITDVGMTGPEDSVIGMKTAGVIHRFRYQVKYRLEPASAGPMLNAVLLDVDESSGKARSVTRIFERVAFP